ncbi:MAG: hypothetical protein ABI833_15710 [Acidobacteriota bacterium]
MQESPKTGYGSNFFWGLAATTVCIALTAVGGLGRNLGWLMIAAWPFAAVAVWSLARSLYSTKGDVRLFTAMGSLLAGGVLLYLHSFQKPLLPSSEQAGLQMRTLTAVPTSPFGSPQLKVSFYDAGKLPVTNAAHYFTVASAGRILSMKEVTDIQDRLLNMVNPGPARDEIYPGQPNDLSFTIPEYAGDWKTIDLLSMDFKHVLDGTRLMYVLVAFGYRDRTMPSDVFGISESCQFFIGTFDRGQGCGRSGTSLQTMDDPPSAH